MKNILLLLFAALIGIPSAYSQSLVSSGPTHLYCSPDSMTHDPWFVNVNGEVHLFHLMGPWHATSTDCVNWKLKKNLDFEHQNLPYFTHQAWTGCAVYHKNKIYNFWTNNQWKDGRFCNSICLAISEDGGETFTQHPSNPLIKPDPRWYDTENDPTPEYEYHGKTHTLDNKNLNLMDWRDISIVKDPESGIFHGFITARLRGKKNQFESACIARVTSKDLVNWEVHPPAFIPEKWGLHEVPTVFQLGSKWYLTVMASYRNKGSMYAGDSCLSWAHLVGQAENLEDEFILVEDNGVMAGNGSKGGYSMRTVDFKDDMLAFTVRRTTENIGVLSQAVKLVPRQEGGLYDMYWHGNDKMFGPLLRTAPGMVRSQMKLKTLPDDDRAYMLTANIRLIDDCAAGITFGQTEAHPGYTFFLDPKNRKMELVRGKQVGEDIFFDRQWDINPKGEYQVRFIFIDNMINMYVDDRQAGSVCPKDMSVGGMVLMTDQGEAEFKELNYQGPLSHSIAKSQLYVSATGSDDNPGTEEKPFATLERAKMAIQNATQIGEDLEFTIWIDDGTYEIEKPLVFESAYFDKNSKVHIRAKSDANPVISGGKAVKSWKEKENGIWVAQLPGKEIWNPRELFIDGKRGTRARFPNEGYLHVKEVGEDRRTNFIFNKGDFPIPKKVDEVELVFLHDWSISRIGVKEISKRERRLTTVDFVGVKDVAFFSMDNWEKHPRYFLENALEFLDADYEWYFNAEEGNVYLKLPENQDPEKMQIVVPFSEGIFVLKGEENNPVGNIHFEGIRFKHCHWQIPEAGYCGAQACFFDARPQPGWTKPVPAAVKATWAENCSFRNCGFENLGGSGLWLSTGCKSCYVTNSNFIDISGNGIMIGEGRGRHIDGEVWWKKVPGQVASGNTIDRCSVSKSGAQFYGAVGIWCGFTENTSIVNNEIYDLPYSGISVGWEWSPVPTPCRNNLIAGNHIHHILNALSDGGGIYMLGLQPGSKLLNNHIHDVKINAGRAESNGMFLDEGTTDVVVANNLIYNIAKSPLRFHRATTNLVKDNYLFCTGENPPIRYNRTSEEDIKQVNNKVFSEDDNNYSEELKRIVANWSFSNAVIVNTW